MKLGTKVAMCASLLSTTMLLAAGSRAQDTAQASAQDSKAEGSVTDDWMQVASAKSKVFLPGQWAYETTTSPEGTLVTAHGGGGKLLLSIQTVEGKQEATAEGLQKIFEQHIASGAAHTDEKSEAGLRRRYTLTIDGQAAIFKAHFVRHADVGYMVYMQALAADVAADPGLEKAMDSVLASFQPV